MKVGVIRDSDARSRLVAVMDALLDFEPLAPFGGVPETRRFVQDALTLGGELALAVARGQQPERVHVQQFDALKRNLDAWDAFLDDQAQIWAQRERLSREQKEEELRRCHREDAELDTLMNVSAEREDQLCSD